jgi:hypothetical protein
VCLMPHTFPIRGIYEFVVGQALLPAAAFLSGSSGHGRVLASVKSRLKAGCSQDRLPHNLRNQFGEKYVALRTSACATKQHMHALAWPGN